MILLGEKTPEPLLKKEIIVAYKSMTGVSLTDSLKPYNPAEHGF